MSEMKSYLPKDPTPKTATVGSQVTLGEVKEVDSKVLQGSHGVGDHRGQVNSNVNPLAGNDKAPRSADLEVGA